MIDLDIFMPTARKRLWNAVFQTHAAFANQHNVRLTIAMAGPWPEFEAIVAAQYGDRIRWLKDLPDGAPGQGYGCAPKWRWCLENLEWADWFYFVADDDCLLPWAVDAMMAHRDPECGVILFQALPVSRAEHIDFTPYTVGREIKQFRVGAVNALLNMRKLKMLPRPLFDVTTKYNDYQLIARLASAHPHKFVSTTVAALSLCELEDLPNEFRAKVIMHNDLGGPQGGNQ